ncbi:MAG: TetR/AcrR family transcriptional regulator [Zetaproteobacteria bacterium]|nr:TetR/AcrR family transcriptional regulator [Zetaproteobacteria bacterium]
MKKRKYTKTRRAEQQEQTRARIVNATVALHEELGPAKTSIKAIAERAGVQRLTVYRHFPDENSLFLACSTQWLTLNPPPDYAEWEKFEQADVRNFEVLLAFYQYYRNTEKLWTKIYRDIEQVPAVRNVMVDFEAYLDTVRDGLLAPWGLKGKSKRQMSITLRHALRFSTWQSLECENLKDKQIADLVMGWIQAISD